MILIFNLAFLWCLLISLLISLLILLLILLLIWRVMIPCCRCIFAANWLSSFKPTPIAFSLPKGIAGLPVPLAKGIGFDKRPSGFDKRPSGFDKKVALTKGQVALTKGQVALTKGQVALTKNYGNKGWGKTHPKAIGGYHGTHASFATQ